MKWIIFVPVLLVALVLDVSFMGALEIGGVSPRLVVVVTAFVAMHAESGSVTWAALLAGVLMDLSDPSMTGPRAPLYLIGSHTLGFFFGAQAVLSVRGIVVRRNPISVGAMSLVLGIAAGLFWTAWWTMRSWYPNSQPPWGDGSALMQLGRQLLQALTSGVVGVPIGWILLKSAPAWGFPSVLTRARTRGGSGRVARE